MLNPDLRKTKSRTCFRSGSLRTPQDCVGLARMLNLKRSHLFKKRLVAKNGGIEATRSPFHLLLCRRLTDFGLARMLDLNRSHLSTKSFGTIPYMPPELLADGRMSRKSDVSVPCRGAAYTFACVADGLELRAASSLRCEWCICCDAAASADAACCPRSVACAAL